VHAEGRPHKHRGGDDTETDAYPLADACHVHDDEHHEQGEQTSGKNEQVLALEPLELRAAPDPLVDIIFRHGTPFFQGTLYCRLHFPIRPSRYAACGRTVPVSGYPDTAVQ